MIYYLNRAEPYFAIVQEIVASLRQGVREAVISVVTEVELLVRPFREHDAREIRMIETILDAPPIRVVELDRTMARLAARIRGNLRLDLADAVIVATALQTGCDVIVGSDARCAQQIRELPYVLLDDLIR